LASKKRWQVHMSLPAGTRFGPYEIRALIGSGGMGEVYRATDTRLGRDVAIKTLRAGTTSRDRLDRFEQEARATAALNHPNIVVVFDVGVFDGAPYVVSELLDGLTIRERMRHGETVPVRAAIDYCQQIARGLAVAHTRGIAHRDLKPENVFVTRDGIVKILDFGLAKLTEPFPARTDPAGVLETHVETQPGIVLGSVGYMAPEQVRGLEADHRCDVFSLGAILYELLSGQRAFRGETRADVMMAILREDPPELGKHIPPGLVRIVTRCLEKAPERRFQSASDLSFALEALSSPSGSDHGTAARAIDFSRAGWRWTWRLAIAAAILAGAGLVAWSLFDRPRDDGAEPLLARFQVVPSEGSRLVVLEPSPIPRFALSLDGRAVAFVAQTGDRTNVWVRPVDSLQQTMVPGTEGAVGSPFWAPDGQSLAFFTSRALKVVDLTRAASRTICEGFFGDAEGSWGDEGTIVGMVTVGGFGTTFFMVPSAGGACDARFFQMGRPGPSFIVARQPHLLPGSRHFIFSSNAPNADHTGVFAASVPDGKAVTRLIEKSSVAAYAAGHLLFIQDGILKAQRFDPQSLRLSGQPRPVTQSVEFSDARSVRLAASLGALAYATARHTQSELIWVDRKGDMRGSVGTPRESGDFDLSPDDRHVAVIAREPTLGRQEVRLIDLADGTQKFLSPRNVAGAVDRPRWSPDGRTVAFTRSLPERNSVVLAPADGGPTREVLVESAPIQLLGWSSDGKSIVYLEGESLLAVPTSGDPKPVTLVERPRGLGEPRLAPNGRSLAYASMDGDVPQIYVTPIPAGSERLTISPRGLDPRYRRDGLELFYRSIQGELMAVDMRPGAPAREARVLFRLDRGVREYAASSDGQRFLLKRLIEGPVPSFTMLINWRQAVN
jgi:Tol biopolymer transport system component